MWIVKALFFIASILAIFILGFLLRDFGLPELVVASLVLISAISVVILFIGSLPWG